MTPSTGQQSKPYKGPESYQIEDAELFFGREVEADQLIAQILSARLTLLHAPSGAGKTSLLNARVIPGLEVRGWRAFRILPQNNPVESIRTTTLTYLLPPPQAELQALERAVTKLCHGDEDLTLTELLARYDQLPSYDEQRRRLISALEEVAPSHDEHAQFGTLTPYFCRLLRSSIEVETFAEHLLAIQPRSEALPATKRVNEQTRMSELRRLLVAPAFQEAYEKLRTELDTPGDDLVAFFSNLVRVYGQRLTGFTLVLILDQFEELFTRFIDPGPASIKAQSELPDWKLRYQMFAQLRQLYGQDGEPAPYTESFNLTAASSDAPALPIRYVISMRDEYIAQLDEVRKFVWDLDKNSYHLNLLDKDQAALAIKQPAEIFGYRYSDSCYHQIITELTLEDRFVEPKHLQLVCDKLWQKRQEQSPDQTTTNNVIEQPMLEDLQGTRGILHLFFAESLATLDNDAERLEALEMLELLVTTSGTRNIIERDVLLNCPFRDRTRREKVLQHLVDRTIIRTERRFRGYFVEITHEFLIAPIHAALQNQLTQDISYNQLRWALRTLEHLYEDRALQQEKKRLLLPEEFRILHERKADISWNLWGAELMLRSAVTIGADKPVLAHWARTVDHFAVIH